MSHSLTVDTSCQSASGGGVWNNEKYSIIVHRLLQIMNSVRRQGYASYSPQEQCEKDQIHMFFYYEHW